VFIFSELPNHYTKGRPPWRPNSGEVAAGSIPNFGRI
jgi:hypothetical protein